MQDARRASAARGRRLFEPCRPPWAPTGRAECASFCRPDRAGAGEALESQLALGSGRPSGREGASALPSAGADRPRSNPAQAGDGVPGPLPPVHAPPACSWVPAPSKVTDQDSFFRAQAVRDPPQIWRADRLASRPCTCPAAPRAHASKLQEQADFSCQRAACVLIPGPGDVPQKSRARPWRSLHSAAFFHPTPSQAGSFPTPPIAGSATTAEKATPVRRGQQINWIAAARQSELRIEPCFGDYLEKSCPSSARPKLRLGRRVFLQRSRAA